MNLLITIAARGGSKGIPGKNIKQIAAKPLIAYTIATAQRFAAQQKNTFVHIALSTDSDEIKTVAAEFGLTTNYTRPLEMATDAAGKLPVLNHLLEFEEKEKNIRFDFVLDLDVTSPLRTVEDLQNAFQLLQNDEQAFNLFSVNAAHRNPYFNMVEQQPNGYFSLIKKLPEGVVTRQAAPKVYDLNASFYFYRRSFFEQQFTTAISPQSLIYQMPHICFDLDEPLDFELLQFLVEQKKLSFEL